MLEALDTDEPGEALHYANLFSDDDDLNQGLTAEIIRSQHLNERLEFLQVLKPRVQSGRNQSAAMFTCPSKYEVCTSVCSSWRRLCRTSLVCPSHKRRAEGQL